MIVYILEGPDPVPCDDIVKWAEWFETHYEERRVGLTEKRGVYVSTVFLGIDHNFGFAGEPVLFETMVFKKGKEVHQERYRNWGEAEAGHHRNVAQYIK